MAQPVWVTPAGNLGTIPEGVFYSTPLEADEPVIPLQIVSTSRSGSLLTLVFEQQFSVPFDVGTDVFLSGFSPSLYNQTYTVIRSSKSSVTVVQASASAITTLGTVANTPDQIYYSLIAGSLPAGMQINTNGIIAGVPQAVATIQGVPNLVSRDVTSKFAVRAYNQKIINGTTVVNRLVDRTFEITVTGQDVPEFITPAGSLGQWFDGSFITEQIEFTDEDPGDTVTIRLIAGTLPPGLTLSNTGLISGYVPPITIGDGKYTYEFTVEISDGTAVGTSARDYSMLIWSRSIMLADTTLITADDTFITADATPIYTPLLLNSPGSIGTVRNDNWFAYKFTGIDPSGEDDVEYVISNQDPGPLPGLTLDPNTGWLYGPIPNLGLTEFVYTFNIRVRKKSLPEYISNPYAFSLAITGPVSTDVVWLTDSDLGTIDNGAISTLFVRAQALGGQVLQYRLASGSTSLLPQGLDLASNGDIQGRVSFNTFALDGGTTVFDTGPLQTPTTFDMKYTFVVQAYTSDGSVNVSKTFSITVIREYNEPYDNLYIQAMPPLNDREILNDLLFDTEIFRPELIYRYNDPYFGVAKNVTYYHAYGLTAATLLDYVNSLDLNHYWKNLVLGEIQVAQARNSVGEVIYEVVYSRIIDNLVNDQGQSVSKDVTLPYPINEDDSTEINTVYPNSLINMRDQVIDTVGQVSNVLPAWMTSKQSDGRVLGFVPAWIIAYAKPGKGAQIAYYIAEKFNQPLNLIDYEVDRYELDRFLSHNWDPVTDNWVPPPAQTYFDNGITDDISLWGNWNTQYTVFTTVNWVNNSGDPVTWTNNYNGQQTTFDGNSLKFIAPVDMYVGTLPNPQVYDKYLVFPKRNILE